MEGRAMPPSRALWALHSRIAFVSGEAHLHLVSSEARACVAFVKGPPAPCITFVSSKARACVAFVKGESRVRIPFDTGKARPLIAFVSDEGHLHIAFDNGEARLHITFVKGEAGRQAPTGTSGHCGQTAEFYSPNNKSGGQGSISSIILYLFEVPLWSHT
ncbi:hypothetical protein GGX14DRAFT_402414 [Mycena pura]|uniref:Uncharacterized protein n=1 Tax=Mycena pura TaxID=153505 RepID=A0AAD6UXY2_9AGAR|nr:hypothetical protein GGX14DRAFT_402414 [Mycena pura]